VVLTLQNGMGNREILEESLRRSSSSSSTSTSTLVLQGITDIGALLTQPGVLFAVDWFSVADASFFHLGRRGSAQWQWNHLFAATPTDESAGNTPYQGLCLLPFEVSGSVPDDAQQVGLKVTITEDVDKRAWVKLMANAAINPLTALFRIPNGALISDKNLLGIAFEVVEEAVTVAKAKQVNLPALFGQTPQTGSGYLN